MTNAPWVWRVDTGVDMKEVVELSGSRLVVHGEEGVDALLGMVRDVWARGSDFEMVTGEFTLLFKRPA